MKLETGNASQNRTRLDSTATFDIAECLLSANNEIIELSGTDGQSRKIVDLMVAFGAVNFGHTNPNIDPFTNYKADLVAFFMPEEAELYASWVCNKVGKPNGRVLFQIGGTYAVSAAISLALQNRPGKVVSIQNGFHGLSIDALSASSLSKNSVLQETAIRKSTQSNFKIIRPGEFISDWSDISCVVYEPVQGAAGLVPLEVEWLHKLCDEASKNGVITIADEVQTGYYRCGAFSYSVEIGLKPNIILFGKSMTNGLFPYSAVVYDKSLEASKFDGDAVYSHTFQPSAIGSYCAYSVSKFIDNHDVDGEVARVSEILMDFSLVLENLGLVTNCHILGPSLSMEYKGDSEKLVRACFDQGVLFTTGGDKGSRLRIMPPITIPSQSLSDALLVIGDTMEAFDL